MEIKKIEAALPLKVKGQKCSNNCEETVWAGKTSAEGNKGGCWTATAYTARGEKRKKIKFI